MIHGQGPDWAEVLAVFAVHTAGKDTGVDVATLDQDRVDLLKAVFWDMTEITSKVETIDHPGGEDSEGWTESILHITITPKTADEMRAVYAFTDEQNSALTELLSDQAALASLAGSLTITSADLLEVIRALPADLDQARKEAVETALSLVGRWDIFGAENPWSLAGTAVGDAPGSDRRGQFHHRHLPPLRLGLLRHDGLDFLQHHGRRIHPGPWRRCHRPALLLHACFPGGRAARRPGLLPGRFPCGDRGGPEGGRETADLPLFQRTKQCGGDGVCRQRLYHPGAAGYFPVNSRNSPQFEGSFELYIFTRGDLAFTELISLGNYDTCTPIHITHKTVANKTGNNFYVYVRFSVNL